MGGTETRVNTTADAIETPVIAAKIALATTVATPRPPAILLISHWQTSNVSRPILPRLTSIPMSTKSGTTPKS